MIKMEVLLHVPQDQEIAFFYSFLRQDPDFLHDIDQKQFADTPLHLAASEGRTQLALEIQRLMPSFGRKLNPDGFSPLDLALHQGHTKTVSAMIRLNPELLCVQGKEGITPLHYTAERDDADMLAEFLLRCPDSIDKLTVREESAVHVAVKNGKLAAFRVFLGWLKRNGRSQLLRWRDWNGNTVLHLAAFTNQPKVMELLVKEVCVNDKNSEGLTALDIVMELPIQVNGRALQILHQKRAKRGSSIDELQTATYADYLSSKISIIEKIIKYGAYLDMGMPGEMRNTVLVVAVLIATTTYQAVLSPPGDVIKDHNPVILNISSVPDNSSTANIISGIGLDLPKTQGADNEHIGKEVRKNHLLTFILLNSIALAASLGMIFLLLPFRSYNLLLHMSLLFLMLSYLVGMNFVSWQEHIACDNIFTWASFYVIFPPIILVKFLALSRQRLLMKPILRSKYRRRNFDG